MIEIVTRGFFDWFASEQTCGVLFTTRSYLLVPLCEVDPLCSIIHQHLNLSSSVYALLIVGCAGCCAVVGAAAAAKQHHPACSAASSDYSRARTEPSTYQ
jgi:hypothetical protein